MTAASRSALLASPEYLVEEAGRCVACGLCLPHCPTYLKTGSEADSPRGRIALIKGVLEKRLPVNERFVGHMDLCLSCRACERACPSSVSYGRLIEGVRPLVEEAKVAQRSPTPRAIRMLRSVATYSALLPWLGQLGRAWQAVSRLVPVSLQRRLPGKSIGEELPPLGSVMSWRTKYPAHGGHRGDVALFLGCVARLTDVETLNASIFVLNRLGYTVHVPKRQTCCGGMHRQGGQTDGAMALRRANIAAFGDDGLRVLTTASGCGAVLQEYAHDGADGVALGQSVQDISTFLSNAPDWDGVQITPFREPVLLHDPCSLRNAMCSEEAPYRLLRRIPGLEVHSLAGNAVCCGAAGTYHLTQPEMATMLRDDKIEQAVASNSGYLLTSNVGCALWLRQGLRAKGKKIEVLHPVTLLARQMGFKHA